MSRSRTPLILGTALAGGVGYYLYNAGGKPEVAEKKFESDMHSAASKIKSELPGRGASAESEGKKIGQEAGVKFDSAVASADKTYQQAKHDAQSYAKDTKAEAMKKIDEVDRKVEDSAAKAKSSISGWFGGK